MRTALADCINAARREHKPVNAFGQRRFFVIGFAPLKIRMTVFNH